MKIKDLKRIIREELKTIKEQRPSVSPVGSGPKPMSPPNTSPVGSGPNSGRPNVSPVGGGSSGRPAPNTSPAFGNGPVSRMMSAQGIKPSDVDANIFEDVYNFCEQQNIEIDTINHESGSAQMEIFILTQIIMKILNL